MTYNCTLLTQYIYDVGNPDHGLGQVQQTGRLNKLMGSKLSSLHNWISNGNIYMHKRYKKTPTEIHSNSKRLHTLTIMNSTVNMRKTFKR